MPQPFAIPPAPGYVRVCALTLPICSHQIRANYFQGKNPMVNLSHFKSTTQL